MTLPDAPASNPSDPIAQVTSMFSHHPPDLPAPTPPQGATPSAQTFDILNPSLDLSQFRSPPGTSGGGTTNFSDLCALFLPDRVRSRPGLTFPLSPGETKAQLVHVAD